MKTHHPNKYSWVHGRLESAPRNTRIFGNQEKRGGMEELSNRMLEEAMHEIGGRALWFRNGLFH